jgi:multicomponent K+:H+ antiporter subunit A
MLFALIALPFAAALVLMLAPRAGRNLSAWVVGAAALAGVALLLSVAPAVFGGEVLRARAPWIEAIGLEFYIRIDGWAWLFAFLVLAIGALIVLYARWYLSPDDPPRRFFAYLALFMGAMLGITLSGNLLLLIVFWELTSISSFLLIGFWNKRHEARAGARMALAVTGGGGLALLAGVLIIGHIVGSYDLDLVLASGDLIRAHPLYIPALVLVLLGAFTKSAQFPFHFWLPHAMAAPTPVSAYLHSATMVKAGVFLLARLHPALAGTEEWLLIVSAIGLATLVLGAVAAVFQQDLKGLLAYSTISHLGLITLLFGLGSPLAVVAGVFHILNHATFKASLFMAAGIIDHETGTRDLRRLGGLYAAMPITGTLAIVASLAMAGVPLLNGFLSKEMFLAETLVFESWPSYELAVPVLAVFAGICSVAYSARFVHEVFFGPKGNPPKAAHEPPRLMRVPVEVLVVLCLAVGIVPNLVVADLLALGAAGVLQGPLPDYHLSIWHGFNLPLLMSAISLAGGLLLYAVLHRRGIAQRIEMLSRGKLAYEGVVAFLIGLARRVTGALETGRLGAYLLWILALILVVGASPFVDLATPLSTQAAQPAGAMAIGLWLLIVTGALTVVATYRRRLVAVIAMGIVGLGVSLVFALLSAPDLALTQLLVDMVTTVLLLMALRYLPALSPPEAARIARWRDAAVAVAAGLGTTLLVYMVLTRPHPSIADYILATTMSEAGGANAVNTVIVDYRGFDTLGEITVFAIAGLVIHALLERTRLTALTPFAAKTPPTHSLLLGICAQLILPLAVAVSVYLFLRGHNAPGGGFIAGLVLAIALILQYIAAGSEWVDARLRHDWNRWMGAGLLVAVATGIGSFALAHPFLTSSTPHVHLPLVGEIHLASAMGFDTGVYVVVFAACLMMLAMLGKVSRWEDKG